MGAGSTEITRELCKIKHLWDTAENANDMSAALQLSDGVSALALQDAAERLNSDCLAEVEKTFRYKRNHLLWTIIRYSGLKNHSGKEKELLYSESIEKAKRMMSVRFCHYLKSYPRNWETDR
ncbi:hypothetical protein KAH81_06960 [bacterium]|nr:hypothetical protein [bacterium]